jgi:uncharacterized protein (TIGR02246 family)
MTYYRSLPCAASLLCVLSLVVSCNQNPQSSSPVAAVDNRANDEAEIRALDADWSKAAADKDIAKIMSYYADTAIMLEPGGPAAKGKEAIQKNWSSTFAAPGTSLTFAPTTIVVARSGDLAYDFGSYDLTAPDKKGKPQSSKGLYVVVWQKEPGGHWHVILDGPTSTTP